jgi:hypothetical protein
MLALGYEGSRSQKARVNDQSVAWGEHILVVYAVAC